MKILHHVAFHATSEQRALLETLGVKTHDCPNTSLPGDTGPPLIKLDADEANPNWPLVHRFLQEWDTGPIIARAIFTPRELNEARWLELCAWENGFPQPQDLRGYTRITYDLSHWCDKCSYGKVQNAPFRIKMEPKWGRRAIMTLNWVFEEVFVPPAIWETVFKPFGIGCRPVVNRKGVELQTVVQLVIEEEVDMVLDRLSVLEVCPACGRRKYTHSTRGYYPPLVQEPKAAIAKTRQAFGEGWALRAVVISQDLRQAMLAHNVRGAEFMPLEGALPAVVA